MTRAKVSPSPMAVADLLTRARHLVEGYGYCGGDFGSPAVGFSLAGAVYRAAGFWAGRNDLHNPETAEQLARWQVCNAAFAALAELLPFGGDPYGAVGTADDLQRMTVVSAAKLLGRAADRVAGRELEGAAA